MNKFAVVQDTTVKTAGKGCPLCGRDVVKDNNILLCPVHGSKPWEKNAEGDKGK